jgi:hypothetical protein
VLSGGLALCAKVACQSTLAPVIREVTACVEVLGNQVEVPLNLAAQVMADNIGVIVLSSKLVPRFEVSTSAVVAATCIGGIVAAGLWAWRGGAKRLMGSRSSGLVAR